MSEVGGSAFKPTHRVRERGAVDWIDVRADGVEPQTYYDRSGSTIYAGIWFQHMEVQHLSDLDRDAIKARAERVARMLVRAGGGDADLLNLVLDDTPALLAALEEAERERDALREENRKAHNDLTWRAASMAWATDGRLSTALVHNAEWIRRTEAERKEAIARAEEAEEESVGWAESSGDWRDKCFEAERRIAAVRNVLAGHPKCDVHDESDPVTCGWKRAVQGVHWALSDPEPKLIDDDRESAWEAWSPGLTDLSKAAPSYYEAFNAGWRAALQPVAETTNHQNRSTT